MKAEHDETVDLSVDLIDLVLAKRHLAEIIQSKK